MESEVRENRTEVGSRFLTWYSSIDKISAVSMGTDKGFFFPGTVY